MPVQGSENMSISESVARGYQFPDGSWRFQPLMEHLEGTAALACSFAEVVGGADWGKVLGLWHDLGKYRPSWQAYLREQCCGKAEVKNGEHAQRGQHSTAGAVLAFLKCCMCGASDAPSEEYRSKLFAAYCLAYCIAGHHAGLPDWLRVQDGAPGAALSERLFTAEGALHQEEIATLKEILRACPVLDQPLPASPPFPNSKAERLDSQSLHEQLHLWVRFLFSCLVDADSLETEAFLDHERCSRRGGHACLQELKERFDDFMEKKQRQAMESAVNGMRRSVLEACRVKALKEPGFFSLTVPTGGGKTLASLAFALEHALHHGKRRIIVAIPYTSIIEQTANVLKYGTDDPETIAKIVCGGGEVLFGEDNVLEHHSNLDPEKETEKGRLAAENWDAPLVVTTNVQLFESLFSAKRSRARRVHNIAESVLILDEAQMLPPEYLIPLLSVLRGLVRYLGVTVLFCTATQPALVGQIGSGEARFSGLPLEDVTEIVGDPEELARSFARVEWHLPQTLDERRSWEELAKELERYEQVLCIVNTRKDCRELHGLMPSGTLHLSALMCPEERSDVIGHIKRALRAGDPMRVISTQLVEAGVDIDFPVVYRALCGIDSLSQAAGRCNREGLREEKGRVVLFVPPRAAPPGLLRKGEDAAREIFATCLREKIEFSPKLYQEYFQEFYRRVNSFDKPCFRQLLVKDARRGQFQFRTFDTRFHLIDERAQSAVVVWYEGRLVRSRDLIEELRRTGPTRRLLRKLQRFTVSVPDMEFAKINQAGFIEEIEGVAVQAAEGLYQPGLGLLPDATRLQEILLC
jgi:CRISPR-associated endonuclease/helicase Cas3